MKINAFACLGFLVSRVIDGRSASDLSYKELFDAAADGRLIRLLAKRYGHIADFTFITHVHSFTSGLRSLISDLRPLASSTY